MWTLFFVALPVGAQDSLHAPDYFTEVFVNNPTPFVGQQITYVFRFYDAVGIQNLDYQPPDFEDLWQIADNRVARSVQQVNGRQYNVSELQTALYPTRAGNIAIESATVILPESVYQEGEQFLTESVLLTVRPLPDGAPATFSGAVGQIQLNASLDRQAITLGETLTLRLTISGTANIEQFTLPEIVFPPNWRVSTQPVVFSYERQNELVIGEKESEYILYPDSPGQHFLDPITISYYDSIALSYRSVTTSAVTIDVLAPVGTNSASQFFEEVQSSLQGESLTLKPPATILQSFGPWNFFSSLQWFLWFLPPVWFCIVCLLVWWRRRHNRLVKYGTSISYVEAHRRLRAARKMQPNHVYPFLRETLFKFSGGMSSSIASSFGTDEFCSQLENINLPTSLKNRLHIGLELINEGQYAAPINSGNNLNELIDYLETILNDIEQIASKL